MNERYVGRVVSIVDDYTVVIDRGANQGIAEGQKFIVLGVGEEIVDPDTKEVLERLEIVRGRVVVTHLQEKIATLKSCEYEYSRDTKEVKKTKVSSSMAIFGMPETITESMIPGERSLKYLEDVEVGDFVVRI